MIRQKTAVPGAIQLKTVLGQQQQQPNISLIYHPDCSTSFVKEQIKVWLRSSCYALEGTTWASKRETTC
jgi:quinolinate synthase